MHKNEVQLKFLLKFRFSKNIVKLKVKNHVYFGSVDEQSLYVSAITPLKKTKKLKVEYYQIKLDKR